MARLGASSGSLSLTEINGWARRTPLSEIDALLPSRVPLHEREVILQKVQMHRAGEHVALSIAELRTLNRARLNHLQGLASGRRKIPANVTAVRQEALAEYRASGASEGAAWAEGAGGDGDEHRAVARDRADDRGLTGDVRLAWVRGFVAAADEVHGL